ncbi:hypothetical protein [Leptolyngbya ohadii]|uniref:hypothetical protein n=1 Tax=Leptolyngbya ohadii TaxID=1962290 RepID=UPI000B599B67|nr:hypothetical protein [Leptolyngbya ohadii]
MTTTTQRQQALELGFFPVEISFSEANWEIIEKHSGSRESPALWLRHVPSVGDEILFKVGEQHYRGRISKRAFEATPAEALFTTDPHSHSYNVFYGLHLWLDRLEPCPNPMDAFSIWDEEA